MKICQAHELHRGGGTCPPAILNFSVTLMGAALETFDFEESRPPPTNRAWRSSWLSFQESTEGPEGRRTATKASIQPEEPRIRRRQGRRHGFLSGGYEWRQPFVLTFSN